MNFAELQNEIARIGVEWHTNTLLENAKRNNPLAARSTREIGSDARPCLIVSAGPSLRRENILKRIDFGGNIVVADGAYVACLKAGIIPQYVVTLDPHPTRMVRWFGDHDIEAHLAEDDYFARQDLDVSFRENAIATNLENIELINKYAERSKFIIANSAPENVVSRLREANANLFWFCPLVDSPGRHDSLTRKLMGERFLPCLNTGGTVSTAAWVFAHTVLKSPNIAMVGCDFGYYLDTPICETQEFHMLGGKEELYPRYTGFWGEHFTSPTYWWYRNNFLDLLRANEARVINCSGAGLLYGPQVDCMELEQWLESCS